MIHPCMCSNSREVFCVSLKSEMGLWLRYVGISGGRCNFDAKNVWLAKNWKIFEFAPLARPSSYLKKKKNTIEDQKKKILRKFSFFSDQSNKITIQLL